MDKSQSTVVAGWLSRAHCSPAHYRGESSITWTQPWGWTRGRNSNVNIAAFMDGRCRKRPWNDFLKMAYFWAHCYGWICLCKYCEHAAIISLSIQVYYYADAQTTHTAYPDGLEVLQFPNNQIGMQELIIWIVCADLFLLWKYGLNFDSSRLGIFFPFHIVFAFHFQCIPSLHFSVSSYKANIIMECKCISSNSDYLIMWCFYFFHQYCRYNLHPHYNVPEKNPDLALCKATWKYTRQTSYIFFSTERH